MVRIAPSTFIMKANMVGKYAFEMARFQISIINKILC
jgi:hypothetical protein